MSRRHWGRSLFVLLWFWMMIAVVPRATAVLIAGPDGSINTTAPLPDPGFANVGLRSGLSGVYVRNGWVLTASHVGLGPITLGGVSYAAVPGSAVVFTNVSAPNADLIAYKLKLRPPLPDLVLATGPPTFGEQVILIGNGQGRGAATTWTSPTSGTTYDGWDLTSLGTTRWGTNRVAFPNTFQLNTQAFGVIFDKLNGQNQNDPEAQAVAGDSGGAAFAFNAGVGELIGIIYARGSVEAGQPLSKALYQDQSFMVDLDFYRSQILAIIDQPDCNDGLDEDGDGLIDFPADPGCLNAFDNDEQSAALVCDNGLDEDGDGLIDFPADPGCLDSLDGGEHDALLVCDNGLDDDGDGLPDFPADFGCVDVLDSSERDASLVCDNGLDDDFDTLIDFPQDDGCIDTLTPSELPEPGLPIALMTGGTALAFAARRRKA